VDKLRPVAPVSQVRNHGDVPRLSWESHRVKVEGLVEHPLELSMDDVAAMPAIELPVTLTCDGNRRKARRSAAVRIRPVASSHFRTDGCGAGTQQHSARRGLRLGPRSDELCGVEGRATASGAGTRRCRHQQRPIRVVRRGRYSGKGSVQFKTKEETECAVEYEGCGECLREHRVCTAHRFRWTGPSILSATSYWPTA
jgi:hypothetical protein